MNGYDQQLKELLAQCARKRKLEASAAELRRQRDTYAARAEELKEAMREEQADVDRLEGRSLAAFFYNVVGKMDEKLTQERQEAYAARVRYDAAARELAGAEEDLARCQAELGTLDGCEEQYAALLREKTQAVKAAGGAAAEQILRMEEREAYLESQERELGEASAAGQSALATADGILESLSSAEGWGTWDLIGGGLIADLAKHSKLDEAQAAVEYLQSQLRAFRTELADVTISADFQVNIDGFLRFADYVFDGIFADWAVLDRINQAQAQVEDKDSIFAHYQALIRLRHEHDVFAQGDFTPLTPDHPAVLAYQRKYQGQELICVSNFYRKECVWKAPVALDGYRVLLSNYSDSEPKAQWTLRPYESVLLLKESH